MAILQTDNTNSLQAQDKNLKLVKIDLVLQSLQTVPFANCLNTPLLSAGLMHLTQQAWLKNAG
jgi:hypothetical protein